MENFFGQSYVFFYQDLLSGNVTNEEVDFIINELNSNMNVLDMCCGHGRHTIELNQKGISALGVELNPETVKLAQQKAENLNLSKSIFKEISVFDLDENEKFDCILLMCNTLGLFLNDDIRLLKKVKSLLKPDGLFIFDITNRDFIPDNFKSQNKMEKNGNTLLTEYSFNSTTNELSIDEIRTINGYQNKYTSKVKAYTVQQITEMLHNVGIEVKNIYSDYKKTPVNNQQPNLVIVSKNINL